jgi:DNA replication licensing factor MCM4
MSSSPLPIPSSDDAEMAVDDELPQTPLQGGGQSMSQAPPADPLFLLGTPSTQAGTPLRGVVARRAVGMHSTPRRNRTPLFARKYTRLGRIPVPLRLTTTFHSGFI